MLYWDAMGGVPMCGQVRSQMIGVSCGAWQLRVEVHAMLVRQSERGDLA